MDKIARCLSQAPRRLLFDQREKCRKAGQELRQFRRARVCSASILLARKWASRRLYSLTLSSDLFSNLCWDDSWRNAGAARWFLSGGGAFDSLVEFLLKSCHLNIERQDLACEGMLRR